MKKVSWISLLTVVGIFLLVTSPAGAAPVVLKFGTVTPPQGWDVVNIIKPFAERVEKDAGGTVKIDIFAGGTLGRNPGEYAQLVLDGVMDMALIINAMQPGRFPDDQVVNIPFTAREPIETTVAFNRMFAKGMIRGYENFLPLGFMGIQQFTIHTTFPVKTPEDLKGVKIHISGKMMQAFTEAVGGVPLGIPATKFAETISRGVIKGAIVDWNAAKQFRFLELTPYHCMLPYGTTVISILMNKDSFNSLPPEAKASFKKHMGEPFAREWALKYTKNVNQLVEEAKNNPKHHVYTPSPEEMEQWKGLMWPVVEKWKKEHPNGKMLYDTYLSEVEKFRKE